MADLRTSASSVESSRRDPGDRPRIARSASGLDNRLVIRRIHTPALHAGDIPLDPTQTRHARDVLRLEDGTAVEAFDDLGTVAPATLHFRGMKEAFVRVEEIRAPDVPHSFYLTVASAVPKGERADWMVEKLSELGVASFVPLATERSVVKPEGKNKHERWVRIAIESAKQSRRAGVMRIGELRPVRGVIGDAARTLYLSTAPDATPLRELLPGMIPNGNMTLLIGPEGGWTDEEMSAFGSAGCRGVKLTATILRVETAAIAAAAVVMTHVVS